MNPFGKMRSQLLKGEFLVQAHGVLQARMKLDIDATKQKIKDLEPLGLHFSMVLILHPET